jgi:hypothetical protein
MRTLSMRIVSYLIKYLREFELIFETILDYEQGTRWVLLMQKNRHGKSHAWAPLSPQQNILLLLVSDFVLQILYFHAETTKY